MVTERYIINFYSIGDKKFDQSKVIMLWEHAAIVEKANCGIFVNCVVETTSLICDMERGCGRDSQSIRVLTMRNPVECEDSTKYFDAVKRVILDVKYKLENPYVGISILNTNYYFFDSM